MNRFKPISHSFPIQLRGWYSIVLLSASFLLGCSGDRTSKYIPTSDTAKQALQTSLETWKSGAALGTISGKPAINVFDARWQEGAKLESFEILEAVTDQEHPQFRVRMKLVDQDDEMTIYRIVGIDPLLVFREQDYIKTTGM